LIFVSLGENPSRLDRFFTGFLYPVVRPKPDTAAE
jgi:hypothetical protein